MGTSRGLLGSWAFPARSCISGSGSTDSNARRREVGASLNAHPLDGDHRRCCAGEPVLRSSRPAPWDGRERGSARKHAGTAQMSFDQSAEIRRLHATVADLLALSTLPETWVGREPPAIAAELADLLVESLQMNFGVVRLCDPEESQAVAVMR